MFAYIYIYVYIHIMYVCVECVYMYIYKYMQMSFRPVSFAWVLAAPELCSSGGASRVSRSWATGVPLCIGAKAKGGVQGLLFWLFQRGFKVSSETVKWYRTSYGTVFDSSENDEP